MAAEVFFEDAEDGGGGEVADLAEALPGEGEGVFGEAEGGLHGFEDFGAAAVEDPTADVGDLEVIGDEELLGVAEQVLFHHLRHFGR